MRTVYWAVHIASVIACTQHKVQLTSTCPHCERSNVKHRASIVIPGYCTSCGGFLGNQKTKLAEPVALWHATRVEQMLARPPEVDADKVHALLEALVEHMAHGRITTLAQEIGLSKSGVWHWFHKGGLPTLPSWLAISQRGDITLDRLFVGDLENWIVPKAHPQLSFPLEQSPRKGIRSRFLNWPVIRAELRQILDAPEAISLAEVSKQLGIDQKQLYQNANELSRAIVSRSSVIG